MRHTFIAISMCALAIIVAACGGGGSGSSTNPAASLPAIAATMTPSSPATVSSPATLDALASVSFTTPSRGAQVGFSTATDFAVYSFDLDLQQPTSQCNSVCAVNWPPIAPPAGVALASPWGTVTRADGSLQLAYNGHPLYTYLQDTKAGIASGDGVNASGAVWHLAQSASLTANSTPAPSATGSSFNY